MAILYCGVLWFLAEHPEENLPPLKVPGWDEQETQKVQSNNTIEAGDKKFHEFILKAAQEIETLYTYIVDAFKIAVKEDNEKKQWINLAKSQIKQHSHEWGFLREEHLNDADVFYGVFTEQERRCFIGRILKEAHLGKWLWLLLFLSGA